MSMETLSNLTVYLLTGISTGFFLCILAKAQWWINLIRISLTSLILGFALTGWYIVARRLGWLTEAPAEIASIAIFGGFATWLLVLWFLLMKYNWNFWSWHSEGGSK